MQFESSHTVDVMLPVQSLASFSVGPTWDAVQESSWARQMNTGRSTDSQLEDIFDLLVDSEYDNDDLTRAIRDQTRSSIASFHENLCKYYQLTGYVTGVVSKDTALAIGRYARS